MLLFVIAILVVFHFALPVRLLEARRARPALGRDRLHRAARPRPRVRAPSGSRACSTGSCSRRSTAARSGSAKGIATLAFLRGGRGRRPAGVRALLRAGRLVEPSLACCSPTLGICAVGTLLAAMAAAGRARELLLPLALPAARAADRDRRRRRERRRQPGRYLGFLALYDAIFALLAWASFEYVVTGVTGTGARSRRGEAPLLAPVAATA